MAAYDLIDEARARLALPSAASSGTDDTAIGALITACSVAITKYCKRGFVSTTYDEIYNGSGHRQLALRNYPIISVQSVRCVPRAVLQIINTSTSNQQARVSVTSTGLSLSRVASGVSSTSTLAFGTYVTLTALGTAINALGNGWSALVTPGYTFYPSADLYPPIQGALNAAGAYAGLLLHTTEMNNYHVDPNRGWLIRSIPMIDPDITDWEGGVWPEGVNNYRVQYTAGYATIPEGVQEACALMVAHHFKLGPRESLATEIPKTILPLLKPYRDHKLIASAG